MVLLLLALGPGLYFAGRFIHSLGQRLAEGLSAAERSVPAVDTAQPTSTTPVTATPTRTPTPTAASFIPPTATATRIPWTSCPGIVISVTDTEKGDLLRVLRCEDGLEYEIGPLTKGVYAVSPDDKYLVYCSLDGVLYAARIGSTTLTVIEKTRRQFYTFGRDMDPIFELTFSGEGPFVLEIYEKRYGQNLPLRMPAWLSAD